MKEKITKAKELISKYDGLFVAIFIFFSLIGINLDVILLNSDELWMFQNTYKIFNGFEIYKDTNLIMTPLFYLMGNLVFKLLGASFFTFRIYGLIIQTVFFILIYKLLKKFNIRKLESLIIIQLLLVLNIFEVIGYNYNLLSLMFWIVGLYLNLKPKKYNTLLQSIIWFLIYFTKQNVAILYGVSLILFEITRKEELKIKLKKIFIEIIGFLILVGISFVIMQFVGCLEGFINFAILGLEEFAVKNIYINWEVMLLVITLGLVNLLTTILVIKKKICSEEEKDLLITLNIFAYPIFLIAYPIFNKYHIMIGAYLMIILLSVLIMTIFRKLDININKTLMLCTFILVIAHFMQSSYYFNDWSKNMKLYEKKYDLTKEHPFYGAIFKDGHFEEIQNVSEYIKNSQRKVIVLSGKSAFYNILFKTSNGIFDLPYKGNFGKDGEEGLLNKVKKLENTEILIEKNENDLIYQESTITREYIKENLEKIGEVEEFEIYFSN